MSLATADIDCTVSPPLSGAMEDCSIARGPQLQPVRRGLAVPFQRTLHRSCSCLRPQISALWASGVHPQDNFLATLLSISKLLASRISVIANLQLLVQNCIVLPTAAFLNPRRRC